MKKRVNFRGYKTPAAILKRRLREGGSAKDFVKLCRMVGMTDEQIKAALLKLTDPPKGAGK
jgi:hypothetical protein